MKEYIPYFAIHAADICIIEVPWPGCGQSKKVGDLAEDVGGDAGATGEVLDVDDRWLYIGSANLANRSMVLDSECGLAIDAGDIVSKWWPILLVALGLIQLASDRTNWLGPAVLIGIAVDDSVHLLSQYEKLRLGGEDPREAIRGAILHTGRAVVTTSLALSLGFLTLMASAWQTISSFGFFVALAILGALVAALFLLPALIFAFERGE